MHGSPERRQQVGNIVGAKFDSNMLSEAVSAILSFPIHIREPAVIRLQARLPDQQQVFFRENEPIEHNDNLDKTTLRELFDLCTRDLLARTLCYVDIPRFYV